VTVELTGEANHRLRIDAGRSRYQLNGLDPQEFPGAATDIADAKGLFCDKAQVDAMLRRTLFSVSQDDSRPALNGVLLEVEPVVEGQALVRMVSTDGHRLSKSERTVAATNYDGSRHRCIVHRRGATELGRILEGSDPSLHIGFSGRSVVFASDKARLQVKQVEESFPDYGRVIPEKGDILVTLPLPDLVGAVRRVAAVSSNKDATLKVEFGDGKLTFEMNHQDLGEAHEELEPTSYQGGRQKVGFNPRYLLEVCGVLGTETVSLELSDQFSPCLVHSDEEPGSVFVVMPMRL
jgi:DNA polymerase-3 subunit beta